MNPYEVLEIAPGSSLEDIKSAYHQKAKLWHPDRFSGEAKVEAEQRFRSLTEAFGLLKETARKEEPSNASPAHSATPAPEQRPQIQLDATAETSAQNKTVDDWFREATAAADAKAYDQGLGLIQYAIRLDGERGEFHALYGKLLDLSGGDKRVLVRTLETALRLNPRDVDSSIRLAQTFQTLGMHARASRLWSVVHNLAPGHAIFAPVGKKPKGKATGEAKGLGEQAADLWAEAKEVLNRLLKRG